MISGQRSENQQLTNIEKDRYSRHILLREVGLAGQQRLKNARVLIVGMGGLGAPAALYLAAAGVGTLGLVDFDVVERSNLQRQILYVETDVGQLKVEAAKKRLEAFNPQLQLELYPEKLMAERASEILPTYDVIFDGTDNFATRYLLNDLCVWHKKPCIHGSIYQFEGQATVFHPGEGPCYRCLFPEPPPPQAAPNCAEAGVLGVLPGQIGLMQATETVKLLLNQGQSLAGRLLRYDALAMSFYEIRIPKDPDCLVCGQNPTITEPVDYVSFCQGARESVGVQVPEMSVTTFEKKRKIPGELTLIDIRNRQELEICKIPGSLSLPLDELESWSANLQRDIAYVITCRSGIRGAKAVARLEADGFEHVWNLKGGVLAWLEAYDSTQARY